VRSAGIENDLVAVLGSSFEDVVVLPIGMGNHWIVSVPANSGYSLRVAVYKPAMPKV
jgi:hypothetical protein